jgi:hypothetical protein
VKDRCCAIGPAEPAEKNVITALAWPVPSLKATSIAAAPTSAAHGWAWHGPQDEGVPGTLESDDTVNQPAPRSVVDGIAAASAGSGRLGSVVGGTAVVGTEATRGTEVITAVVEVPGGNAVVDVVGTAMFTAGDSTT